MHYKICVEWDAEAGVWIKDSNVPGLVGEAPTLEALMSLLRVRVPEMLGENGCPADDWAKVGRAALDNPDLPIEFVRDTLLAIEEESEPFDQV